MSEAVEQHIDVVGLNHRSAPVEVRERLALAGEALSGVAQEVVAIPGVAEAVVLSTCNRVEIVALSGGALSAPQHLAEPVVGRSGLTGEFVERHLYSHRDRDAVRHLFRVASSLDSMVVGEPQILGQLKEQFTQSAKVRAAGPVLHRAFDKGFSVAKRVRNETGIAERSVSVASAAVDLASHIFESLSGHAVMLYGTGEMGQATARHLIDAGASPPMVVSRTFENAVELARVLEGTPVPTERAAGYLPLADLVIGSAGGGVLVSRDDAAAALRQRRHRPVFFIDVAVPRNFDPEINDLDGAYLYDIDDLGAVVEENLGERRREAVRGEFIVEAEVDAFWQWFEKLGATPTIVDLRDYAEAIRGAEVARTLAKLDLSGEDRDRIERMTQAIVNKLLHGPTSRLKEETSLEREAGLAATVRRLFGLGSER